MKHREISVKTDGKAVVAADLDVWVVLLECFFFFFFFFYEWEHKTGKMCPFSSLHPLKKGKEV